MSVRWRARWTLRLDLHLYTIKYPIKYVKCLIILKKFKELCLIITSLEIPLNPLLDLMPELHETASAPTPAPPRLPAGRSSPVRMATTFYGSTRDYSQTP